MAKKDNTLYYIIGAAILGGAGFLFYRQWKKKKDTPEPIKPLPPSPGPAPVPTPSGPAPASATKISELQNLMIKRYIQLNRDDEYNAAAAKGGWGNKSTAALQYLQPTNFASRGIPNANNIDAWIASIKKDVETTAKEEQTQQTKQKTQAELIALENALLKHLNAKPGVNKIKLLTDVKAAAWQWDAARNRYVSLDETKSFSKGTSYFAKEIWSRGNGTIGPGYANGKRYFIPASAFIAV